MNDLFISIIFTCLQVIVHSISCDAEQLQYEATFFIFQELNISNIFVEQVDHKIKYVVIFIA